MTDGVGTGRPRTSTTRLLVTVAVLSAALAAGCNGSDGPPKPTNSPSGSPTSAAPEWESKYNDKELAVYREAVQRVEAYEAKTQPIWAEGKASKAAKELFQDNLLAWQPTFAQLQSFEKQGIKVARRPEPLSTEAKSIKLLKGNEASVELTRCTDQTDLGGTMNGEPLANANDEPVIQEVDVYRYSDGRWRIGVFKTLEKTCSV